MSVMFGLAAKIALLASAAFPAAPDAPPAPTFAAPPAPAHAAIRTRPPRIGPRLLSRVRRAPDRAHPFVARGLDAEAIVRAGGQVDAIIGPIVSGRARGDTLFELARAAEYLDAPQRLRPMLDVSREIVGADRTDTGHGFSVPHRGAGVLIAAYDSGVDLRHPDLRVPDGSSRVIAYWDQDGAQCDSRALANDQCATTDPSGHGTQVLAIAASNGPVYRGVAPEAELVVARSNLFEDLVGALAWFESVAREAGRPMVVNLSLGGHEGAHDGTSLEAQAIEAFPFLVVAAAGNEGTAPIHARTTLTDATPADVGLDLGATTERVVAIVEIWGEPSQRLRAQLVQVRDGQIVWTSTSVAPGEPGVDGELDRDGVAAGRVSLEAETGPNPFNSKNHIIIELEVSGYDPERSGLLAVRLSGTGSVDLWIDAPADVERPASFLRGGDLGLPSQVEPDSAFTLSDPATAPSALAVSSFVSRVEIATADGTVIQLGGSLGSLSGFSSHGPSLAPERTGDKPELAAPGQTIVAALSGDAQRPGSLRLSPLYRAGSGTSFAVPHATGAAALLLEVEPSADKARLVSLLLESAAEAPSEDPRWGRGQLDVAKAVSSVAGTAGCSCQTYPHRTDAAGPTILALLALLAASTARRLSGAGPRVTPGACTPGTGDPAGGSWVGARGR